MKKLKASKSSKELMKQRQDEMDKQRQEKELGFVSHQSELFEIAIQQVIQQQRDEMRTTEMNYLDTEQACRRSETELYCERTVYNVHESCTIWSMYVQCTHINYGLLAFEPFNCFVQHVLMGQGIDHFSLYNYMYTFTCTFGFPDMYKTT